MTWLSANIWWCGDEYCDCTQPQIKLVVKNGQFYQHYLVDAGTFFSKADRHEIAQQKNELRKLAHIYNIPLKKGVGCVEL